MKHLLFITIILIFQGTLEKIVPIIGYFDEILLLLLMCTLFFKYTTNKIEIKLYRAEIYIAILILIFFTIGIISNLNYGLGGNILYYFTSGILTIKNFLVYILARIVFRKIQINENLLLKLNKLFDFILNIYVTIILLDIPFNFLQGYGIRYNLIKSVSVGFSHPAELDFMAFSIMVIQLFIFKILNLNMKKYKYTLIKSFIIVFFGGRTKGLVFYVIYVIPFILSKLLKKIKLLHVLVCTPFIVKISKERFLSEFFNTESVRGTLYRIGYKIANDFYPLGSGFATYGTEFSRKKYSSLYYYYGISNKYGLSPNWPAYITDAHWAAIIGETGIFGVLTYAIICIIFTYNLVSFNKCDLQLRLSITALWIYGLISSVSDTILMSYRGVAISFITAFFINIILNKDDISQKDIKISENCKEYN